MTGKSLVKLKCPPTHTLEALEPPPQRSVLSTVGLKSRKNPNPTRDRKQAECSRDAQQGKVQGPPITLSRF